MSGEITTTKVEDEIPRYEPKNPFNYSKVQLAKRKKAVSDAEKDFPNVPGLWIEWMYDLLEQKTESEIEKLIESGEWEKHTNTERQHGGTMQSGEVLDKEHLDF